MTWFDCGVYIIRNVVNDKVYVGRKGAASRWGSSFIEPKPNKCFYEKQLSNTCNDTAVCAAQEA